MSSEKSYVLEINPSSSSECSPDVKRGRRDTHRAGARGSRIGRGYGGHRGRRGQGRRGSRAGGRQTPGEEERLVALQEERRVRTEELLESLTLGEYRELGHQLFAREPGLIFDAVMMHKQHHGAPQSAGLQGMPWCTCGRCRDMPTDREKMCCGQNPESCTSQMPHFRLYCLDEGNLRSHRRYREDLLVVRPAREPGDDNREYRFAAYRHFIFWQHGSLGQGNRQVIPSCCVWAIRDCFPDPYGQYTGFVGGR